MFGNSFAPGTMQLGGDILFSSKDGWYLPAFLIVLGGGVGIVLGHCLGRWLFPADSSLNLYLLGTRVVATK